MKFEKFEIGDEVILSDKSEKEPKGVIGKVVDITTEEGKVPYTVDWENGTAGEYGTVDLTKIIEENEVKEDVKETVLPFKVVTDNTKKEQDEKFNEELVAKEEINRLFDDYKDRFSAIALVGRTEEGIQTMYVGVDVMEAYWFLQAAANTLMNSALAGDYEDE